MVQLPKSPERHFTDLFPDIVAEKQDNIINLEYKELHKFKRSQATHVPLNTETYSINSERGQRDVKRNARHVKAHHLKRTKIRSVEREAFRKEDTENNPSYEFYRNKHKPTNIESNVDENNSIKTHPFPNHGEPYGLNSYPRNHGFNEEVHKNGAKNAASDISYLQNEAVRDFENSHYLKNELERDSVNKHYLENKPERDSVNKDYLKNEPERDFVTENYLENKPEQESLNKHYLKNESERYSVNGQYLKMNQNEII
ncbi:hypothetical protein CDAR_245521 [Caerostris darwini]|uniref:Uncharacterized protein n=1 Tax=Caerostris darwini TaxID=1538125 RepID=A0AAV4P3N4_9ARAC|nr:hypothetical protein CDAR_245201 [Caerostris darwini]GIX89817.1 hypothetical protein CDAR_245521 [Caerostris darwini]